MTSEDDRQIAEWLEERGHTKPEIDKILARLRQFDSEARRDSIFDSIEAGTFNIAKIIKEALEEDHDAE